jgi:hypothetical protein
VNGPRLAAALGYAAAGWPVFPCKPGRKEPMTRHGFHDATTDPELVCAWWSAWPDANVAVATGAPGPDVLDIDVRAAEGGWPSLNRLTRAGLLHAGTAWVATASGGRHVYLRGTGQRCGSLPRLHLDFKARGGYVIAPPSVVGGRPYAVRVHRPITGTLDWQAARQLLGPPPATPRRTTARHGGIGGLVQWMERQPHGNRNHGLFWAANRAIDAGLDPWPLVAAAVKAGHDERRAVRTVASALRGRAGA